MSKNIKILLSIGLIICLIVCNSFGLLAITSKNVNANEDTNKNDDNNQNNGQVDGEDDETPTTLPEPIIHTQNGEFQTENQISLKLSVQWTATWVEGTDFAIVTVDVFLLYTSIQFVHDKISQVSIGNAKRDFIVPAYSDIRTGSYDIMQLKIQSFSADVPCQNNSLNLTIFAKMYFGGIYSGSNVDEIIATKNIAVLFI